MKRNGTIFSFLMVLCVLVSCERNKIAKELRAFQKTAIEIPQTLYVVNNGAVGDPWEAPGIPIFIVYYDTLSCSSCRINHLPDLEDLYEISDSLGTFDVMVIFSPREYEVIEVIDRLCDVDFPRPVYVDDGLFRETNRGIPANEMYHSFLIDRAGHPVFVGNPLASDNMRDLFFRVLNKQ